MDMSVAIAGHEHCEDMAVEPAQAAHGEDHAWKSCDHAAELKKATAHVQLAQLTPPVLVDLPVSRLDIWEEHPDPADHPFPEIRPPPPDPPFARKTVFLT